MPRSTASTTWSGRSWRRCGGQWTTNGFATTPPPPYWYLSHYVEHPQRRTPLLVHPRTSTTGPQSGRRGQSPHSASPYRSHTLHLPRTCPELPRPSHPPRTAHPGNHLRWGNLPKAAAKTGALCDDKRVEGTASTGAWQLSARKRQLLLARHLQINRVRHPALRGRTHPPRHLQRRLPSLRWQPLGTVPATHLRNHHTRTGGTQIWSSSLPLTGRTVFESTQRTGRITQQGITTAGISPVLGGRRKN